jgi:hypothetical protein
MIARVAGLQERANSAKGHCRHDVRISRVGERGRLVSRPTSAPCGGRDRIARFYSLPGHALGRFFGGFGEKSALMNVGRKGRR